MDSSILSRADSRPVLASLLGGAWILMGFFGLINGTVLVAGLSQGVEIGKHDPMAEIASHSPELVDPAWFEAQEKKQAKLALERGHGIPLMLLAATGMFGGIWLLANRRRARTVLALAGIGVIALSALHAKKMYELSMQSSVAIDIPSEATTAMWSIAAINVALQSLPVAIGVGLLRHPSLGAWVRAAR